MNALANSAVVTDMPLVNLLDYGRADLQTYFETIGEPKFRAEQIIKWVHQQGVTDFSVMTNLSKPLREHLQAHAVILIPEIAHCQKSKDGTVKWLLRLQDGQCIETVFIPEEGRGTLCVSSQVGCALNCQFCATATLGFKRNLTLSEIIGQLWLAVRELSNDNTNREHIITNVVFMGMGEPLLNLENVVKAISLMLDDTAYNLSKYRVTLSTSGLVPYMDKLAEVSDVSLAVSLHAPNNPLRNQLVPINKKYPLEDLMEACKRFFNDEPRRKVTFEYVMLKGVNDSKAHAKELITLLKDVPAKLNLIPFNPFTASRYECSTLDTINAFRFELVRAGINTVTRKTRGDDINAACGQLVGKA